MTNQELLDWAKKYGDQCLISRKKFAALLPEIHKRRLYKRKFHSIYEFAARLAGMTAQHVDEVLKLQALIASQGWSKVRVVANVATKQNQGELAEIVQSLPKRAVETYVREKFSPGRELPEKKVRLTSKAELLFAKLKKALESEGNMKITDSRAMELLLKKLDKEVKGRKRRATKPGRSVGAARRREVMGNGQCSMGTCRRLATEVHHPERYALVKNHDKLTALCHEHHQIAHAGLIKNEFENPKIWELRSEPAPNMVDLKYLEMI